MLMLLSCLQDILQCTLQKLCTLQFRRNMSKNRSKIYFRNTLLHVQINIDYNVYLFTVQVWFQYQRIFYEHYQCKIFPLHSTLDLPDRFSSRVTQILLRFGIVDGNCETLAQSRTVYNSKTVLFVQ